MSEEAQSWQNVDLLGSFEKKFVRPKKGKTLIVGSRLYGDGKPDRRLRYKDCVGIDMQEGDGVDLVHNLELPLPEYNASFAHVECMSVLEHCRRPWLMADTITTLMRPRASIFLTVPFVWRPHSYPSDYWRFTTKGVQELFPEIEWEVLEYSIGFELAKGVFKQSVLTPTGVVPFLPRTEVLGFGHKTS
jgi:hypothetical protein